MKEIYKRRSIRSFIDKEVSEDIIDNILRAGMQAPSGANQQPWEFIVNKNKNSIRYLSDLHPGSKFACNAGAMITILGNKDYLSKPHHLESDLGACTQNMLLEVVHHGLGATWIGVNGQEERENYVRDFFKLPDNIHPYAIISLGYSDKENTYVDRYKPERVYNEVYIK